MKNNILKNKRKITITFICILVFLLFSLMLLSSILTKSSVKKEVSYENIRTIQDVLSYYKCRFISEKNSSLKDFNKDINLVFKYKLYDDDVSNEEFFTNVIKDSAKVLQYINFRLVDRENDIEIKVICKNNEIYKILINDIENYFSYMDSKINLKKYSELSITEMKVDSIEVQNLINNNWESNTTNFGSRDSIFDNYYEYFDEGIKTRTIDGKIYNIIFDKKYEGNVINGIFPGVDLKTIKAKIGQPTFEDNELKTIGYKGKNIYVFFTEEQISIYRVSSADTIDFFKLVDKFLNDELDLLDFMNELTYLWPDYSEYNYASDFAFISYPLKGVDIKIDNDGENGIIIYNNINTKLSKIENYLEKPEFIAKLQTDNVFEAEKRRLEKENSLLEKCDEFINEKDDEEKNLIGESLKFAEYAELDYNENIIDIKFISKDGNNPNRELNDGMETFLWINDDIIIYNQKNIGIYSYNVLTGEKNILISGKATYELKSFKDGILKYDDSELIIQY